MGRIATLLLGAGTAAAAFALTAAAQPSALAQAQPGLWEIAGAPGTRSPIRQCVSTVATLARFEHRMKSCSAKLLKDTGSSAEVDYSCGGGEFGHSEIDVLTPRALRISTQGISDGLPFNYVLQAHRVDDCPRNASLAGH